MPRVIVEHRSPAKDGSPRPGVVRVTYPCVRPPPPLPPARPKKRKAPLPPAPPPLDELPPRIPDDLAELTEAVALLGEAATKGLRKTAPQLRLAELLGRLPHTPAEARVWKDALKAYRKELIALGNLDDD
jgi:hypothetical protein